MRAAILAAVWSVVALPATAGYADHGPNNMMPTNDVSVCTDIASTPCRTDNAQLTVYRGATLSTESKSDVFTGTNSWYNPTDLDVSYVSTAVTSGDAETDLLYGISNSVPSGLAAYYYCDDPLTYDWKCDSGYALFRHNDFVNPTRVCHETGHGVGLTHGSNADAQPEMTDTDATLYCLKTPSVEPDGLGPHNIYWVNYVYPN